MMKIRFDEAPSPCTKVCRIDERTQWCQGCWRSLDEIATWSTLDNAAKHTVLMAVAIRRDIQKS
jgi:uncharacterized protein